METTSHSNIRTKKKKGVITNIIDTINYDRRTVLSLCILTRIGKNLREKKR